MPRRPIAQILVIVLAVLVSTSATADPIDDAVAAVGRGDYPAALRTFRALADQDNTTAQYNLGMMYARGLGVAQDYAEATKWVGIAAEKGLAAAQNDYANMYRVGRGVARNEAEAVNWYRRAADQDFLPAQTNLGHMYALGYGVPQNIGEALKWYRQAAEQDSPFAQNIVGIAYEHGISVEQSYEDALEWYRRAANKASDLSDLRLTHGPQYNLAEMYASGRGVPKDNVQAYMWFTLAMRFGDVKSPDPLGAAMFGASKETAMERRDAIAKLLTREQIAESERLARDWAPRLLLTIRPPAK
jgi:hypothetical protein